MLCTLNEDWTKIRILEQRTTYWTIWPQLLEAQNSYHGKETKNYNSSLGTL